MLTYACQSLVDLPVLSFQGFRIVESLTHAILIIFLRLRRLARHPGELDRQLHRPVESGDDADAALDDDLGLRRRQAVIGCLQRLDAALLPLQEALEHRRPSGICG